MNKRKKEKERKKREKERKKLEIVGSFEVRANDRAAWTNY